MIFVVSFLFAAYILYRVFVKPGIRTGKTEGFFLNFPYEMVSGSLLEHYYRGIRIIKTLERNEHDYKVIGEITYKGFFNRKPDTRVIYFKQSKSDYMETVFDKHGNISKRRVIENGNEKHREEYEYSYNSSTGKYDKKVEVSYKNGVLDYKTLYENNKIKEKVRYDENGNEKHREEYDYSYNSSTGKYDKKVEVSYENGVLAYKTLYENNKIKEMVWYDVNGNEKGRHDFNE